MARYAAGAQRAGELPAHLYQLDADASSAFLTMRHMRAEHRRVALRFRFHCARARGPSAPCPLCGLAPCSHFHHLGSCCDAEVKQVHTLYHHKAVEQIVAHERAQPRRRRHDPRRRRRGHRAQRRRSEQHYRPAPARLHAAARPVHHSRLAAAAFRLDRGAQLAQGTHPPRGRAPCHDHPARIHLLQPVLRPRNGRWQTRQVHAGVRRRPASPAPPVIRPRPAALASGAGARFEWEDDVDRHGPPRPDSRLASVWEAARAALELQLDSGDAVLASGPGGLAAFFWPSAAGPDGGQSLARALADLALGGVPGWGPTVGALLPDGARRAAAGSEQALQWLAVVEARQAEERAQQGAGDTAARRHAGQLLAGFLART